MNKYSAFKAISTVLFLIVFAWRVSAQTEQISGTVTLKQADGRVVPVAGAVVDIYRTDVRSKFEITTDKRGVFTKPGLAYVGTYTLTVSAPGARPDYRASVLLGRQTVYDFVLVPGDGSRLTLEHVKAIAVGAAPLAPARGSAEERAGREEMERKLNEIKEKNAEITRANEVVSRTFKSGNEALNAGRVEDAIAQYREGLAARPDELSLMTNLSEALRRRGINRYNDALKASPPATAGLEAAKKDWTEAARLSRKALDIMKSVLMTDPAPQQTRLAALVAHALTMRLVATKVDQTQASAAWRAYQDYIAIETDPAKRTKLQGEALQMLFDAGDTDLAVAEARKVLASEPNNADASRILGLALFVSGDKKNFQEAANHLQHYVDMALDTDPLKPFAKESLDYLKTAENITPSRRQAPPSQPQRRP